MNDKNKNRIFERSQKGIDDVIESVTEILKKVKNDGDQALYDFTFKYDKVSLDKRPFLISKEEFIQAKNSLKPEIKDSIDFAIKNITQFHKRQKIEQLPLEELLPGVWAGEKATPIDSLGIYVPSGRGSFPSMLYMAAIPAILAGVKRICVASPPNKDKGVDAATLYAASQCGISEFYCVGGAQAIAALAYGTESVKKCAMITGPGSKYVTAAKRILFGTVDVGLPAGPSESIIIADEHADPKITTLDLLTEAEHGSDSSALLITPSKQLALKVKEYIEIESKTLSPIRKKFVEDVMSGYGGIIITKDLDEAIKISNEIATEHLQISTKNPEQIAKKIRNAGEILLGATPFSLANYAIGPNAILPTGGNAKTFSALSVRDFIKYSSIIKTDKIGIETLSPAVEILAKYEGFEAHKNALSKRSI